MKKVLLGGLLMILSLGLFASGSSEATGSSGGTVFNIYAWNTEFQDRFEKYFEDAGLVPDGVTVNWVITPNEGNAYQNKLDEALLSQSSASANDRVDLFLVEADYALKYVNSEYSLDVIDDIGLTNAQLSDMYQYTKDIMTDSSGVLKGVSWQATPAGFLYRRSYMEDVIGTSDPAAVQEALSDWDSFDEVAAMAKEEGYFMVSGYDDAYRVFSDNMTGPWVEGNTIRIDPSIEAWIDQTKTYTEQGYNNRTSLWAAEWSQGFGEDGNVMGYFGPGWFIDFVAAPGSKADPDGPNAVGNGSYGDWAFIKGPQGFSWGGTWLVGAAGSDNVELIREVMRVLTTDEDTLVSIATELGDFTNNSEAMAEIASSSYSNPFLGGQNHVSYFLDSASSIDRSNMSSYDQGMTEQLQSAFIDYFNGTVSKEQAWNNFYTSVLELYPNLKR